MSRSSASTDLPVFIGGRYRLETLLGRGGAGEVWAATDSVLGRRVAVKLLRDHVRGDATTAERFRREATSAARLGHPNVVTIFDIGDAEADQPFLVMELVDGPNLADVLADGAVDRDTAVAIAWHVASALGAAHEDGLVHRDIKPANVLVSRAGIAKVADFGVAKALGDAAATLTGDGAIVGTAAYLAPEQVSGDGTGPESDVYAVGLLLWELLTGRSPFGEGTMSELVARRLSTDVPPLPDELGVPDDLARVVSTATRRAKGQRFPDGGALAAALATSVPDDPEVLLQELAATRSGHADGPRTAILDQTVAHDALGTTRIIAPPPGDADAGVDADATRIVPTTDAAVGGRVRQDREPADTTTGELPAVPATPAAAPRRSPSARPAGPGASPAPAAAPAHAEEGGATGSAHDARRWLPVAIAAVLVVWLLSLLGGGDGGEGGAPAPQATAGSGPLSIAGGGDHDPFGGDGEHPEDVPAAFDGDTATAWTTQNYKTADFGGLKEGVGMWVDLGEPAAVSRVELDFGTAGAAVSLYALSEQPGGDPGAWGEAVGSLDEAPSAAVVDLAEPVEARYWLVWLTRLPADGRTTIQELRLFPAS